MADVISTVLGLAVLALLAWWLWQKVHAKGGCGCGGGGGGPDLSFAAPGGCA